MTDRTPSKRHLMPEESNVEIKKPFIQHQNPETMASEKNQPYNHKLCTKKYNQSIIPKMITYTKKNANGETVVYLSDHSETYKIILPSSNAASLYKLLLPSSKTVVINNKGEIQDNVNVANSIQEKNVSELLKPVKSSEKMSASTELNIFMKTKPYSVNRKTECIQVKHNVVDYKCDKIANLPVVSNYIMIGNALVQLPLELLTHNGNTDITKVPVDSNSLKNCTNSTKGYNSSKKVVQLGHEVSLPSAVKNIHKRNNENENLEFLGTSTEQKMERAKLLKGVDSDKCDSNVSLSFKSNSDSDLTEGNTKEVQLGQTVLLQPANKIIHEQNNENKTAHFLELSTEQKLERSNLLDGADTGKGDNNVLLALKRNTELTKGSKNVVTMQLGQKVLLPSAINSIREQNNEDQTFQVQGSAKEQKLERNKLIDGANTGNGDSNVPLADSKLDASTSSIVTRTQAQPSNQTDLKDTLGHEVKRVNSNKQQPGKDSVSDVNRPVYVIHDTNKFKQLCNLKVGQIVDQKSLVELAKQKPKISNTLSSGSISKNLLCESVGPRSQKGISLPCDKQLVHKHETTDQKTISVTAEKKQDNFSLKKNENMNCSSNRGLELQGKTLVTLSRSNEGTTFTIQKAKNAKALSKSNETLEHKHFNESKYQHINGNKYIKIMRKSLEDHKNVLKTSKININEIDPKVPLNADDLSKETVEALTVLHRNGYNIPPLIRKKKKQKKNTKGHLPKVPCILPSCKEMFFDVRRLLEHLDEFHRANIDIVDLKFKTFDEFLKWKGTEETDLCLKFTRPRSGFQNKKTGYCLETYVCNKSGHYRPQPTRIGAKPRARSTIKINGLCLSRMYIKHFHSKYFEAKYLEAEPFVRQVHANKSVLDTNVSADCAQDKTLHFNVHLPQHSEMEDSVQVRYVKTHNHPTGIERVIKYKKKKKVAKKADSERSLSSTETGKLTKRTPNKITSSKRELQYKDCSGTIASKSSSANKQQVVVQNVGQLNTLEGGSVLSSVQNIVEENKYVSMPHEHSVSTDKVYVVPDHSQLQVLGSLPDNLDYRNCESDNVYATTDYNHEKKGLHKVYSQQWNSLVKSNPPVSVVADNDTSKSCGNQLKFTSFDTGLSVVKRLAQNSEFQIFAKNEFVPEASTTTVSNAQHSNFEFVESDNDDGDDANFIPVTVAVNPKAEYTNTFESIKYRPNSTGEKMEHAKQLLQVIEQQVSNPSMTESQLDYVVEALKKIDQNNTKLQDSVR